MIGHASGHRRGARVRVLQRAVEPREVVLEEVQGHRRLEVVDLAAEGVGEPVNRRMLLGSPDATTVTIISPRARQQPTAIEKEGIASAASSRVRRERRHVHGKPDARRSAAEPLCRQRDQVSSMVLREPDGWATFDRRDVERLPVLLGESGGFHSIWAQEGEVRLGDVTFDQLGDGRRLFLRVARGTERLGSVRDVVRTLGASRPVWRSVPSPAPDTIVAAQASATGLHTRVQRFVGTVPVRGALYTVHWHPERGVYA